MFTSRLLKKIYTSKEILSKHLNILKVEYTPKMSDFQAPVYKNPGQISFNLPKAHFACHASP